MKVLSIRQPWAWLIVHGFKDIENRNWPTKYRGQFLVHASKGMTLAEYNAAYNMAAVINPFLDLPEFDALERGGIVGAADIVDCVKQWPSEWFVGEYGFVIRNAKPLPFTPMRGMLGFFEAPSSLDDQDRGEDAWIHDPDMGAR